MRKVAVVFGTRPEAIKLAPVVLELKKYKDVSVSICVTGQHREMLDQVLAVFEIVPDVDLKLMRPNQTLTELTSRMIDALGRYLTEIKPDVVVVQGDTTTVFCASLAAFYHKIPIAHVEAGLRTYDLLSPWPEEANRVLTTRLAKWHFAPTETNRQNLLREGVDNAFITVTGNTVIDALMVARSKVIVQPPPIQGLHGNSLAAFGKQRMVLITGHRRENFGTGFEHICRAVYRLAVAFPDVHFVYPVHLNPNVREPVLRILSAGESRSANIHLVEPQPYLSFVALMNRSCLILTDSGGVQEEAPSLGIPVLVMRDTTERPEAIMAGTVKLVGTDEETIFNEAALLLTNEEIRKKATKIRNPYGDGHAAERIVSILR